MKGGELEHLFGEWRHLTEVEGRAISGGNWPEVWRQQLRKQDLQVHLLRARETWQNLWPDAGQSQADFESRFRSIVKELIALEATNAQLVATARESAQRELAECDRAVGHLRGLNRAYGPAGVGHWTSYS